MHGKRFLNRETIDLRGARAGYPEAAIEFAQQAFGFDLLAVAPGEFLMGSPPEEQGRFGDENQHRVRLTQPYWIGRYPVTQAQFQSVMGDNPSQFKVARRPVENVDWHRAMEFCAKLTEQARAAGCLPEDFEFRLPSEAEWEYACRAGTTTAFNDGSACTKPEGKDPALLRLGWHGEADKGQTHPVGEKEPNAWGLYDMHGNVWEWCLDFADWKDRVVTDTYVDGIADPLCTEGAGRVVRGGSYWYQARFCRSACRCAFVPGLRSWILGFRLAAGQSPSGRGAPSPGGGRRGSAGAGGTRRPAGERSEPAGGKLEGRQEPR
jgi:formylglycine-generating enzyme required for sulfatase activity